MKRISILLSMLILGSGAVHANNGIGDVIGDILRDELNGSQQQRQIGWFNPEIKSTLSELCKNANRVRPCKKEYRQKLRSYKTQYSSATAALFGAISQIETLKLKVTQLEEIQIDRSRADRDHDNRNRAPRRDRPAPTERGEFVEFYSKYGCQYADNEFVLENLNLSQYRDKYATCTQANFEFQRADLYIKSVKINGICKSIANPAETIMDTCMGLSLDMPSTKPLITVNFYGQIGCDGSGRISGEAFTLSENMDKNAHILDYLKKYQGRYYAYESSGDISLGAVEINGICYRPSKLSTDPAIRNDFQDNDSIVLRVAKDIIEGIVQNYDFYINR